MTPAWTPTRPDGWASMMCTEKVFLTFWGAVVSSSSTLPVRGVVVRVRRLGSEVRLCDPCACAGLVVLAFSRMRRNVRLSSYCVVSFLCQFGISACFRVPSTRFQLVVRAALRRARACCACKSPHAFAHAPASAADMCEPFPVPRVVAVLWLRRRSERTHGRPRD